MGFSKQLLNYCYFCFKFCLGAWVFLTSPQNLRAEPSCADQIRAIFERNNSDSMDLMIPETVMEQVDLMLQKNLGLSLPENFETRLWAENPDTGLKQVLLGPLVPNENTPPKVRALWEEAEKNGAKIYVHSIAFDPKKPPTEEMLQNLEFGPSNFVNRPDSNELFIAISPAHGLQPFVLAHENQHLKDFVKITNELKQSGLSKEEIEKQIASRWNSPRGTFLAERNAVIAEAKFRRSEILDGELPPNLDSTNPLNSLYIQRIVYPYFAALTLSTKQVALFFNIHSQMKLGLTEAEIAKRLAEVGRILEPIFWRKLIAARAHFEAFLNHTASLQAGSAIETATLEGFSEFIQGLATWKGTARNIGLLKDYVEYSRSLSTPLEKRVFKSLPMTESWEKTRIKYLEKNPYGRNPQKPDLFHFALSRADINPMDLARLLVEKRRLEQR